MSASVTYVVFPGPVRAVMEIARTHGYYAPASEQDTAAAALLHYSGLLVYEPARGTLVPTETLPQWLDLAKMPTRKIAVAS